MNKKKIIRILLLILLPIVIGCGVYFIFFHKNNNIIDNNGTKTKYYVTREEILKLIKNDYKIAKFMYDVPNVRKENMKIDNIKYYYVDDDNIKNTDDLIKLLDDTYTPVSANRYEYIMFQNSRFVESDGQLYIRKKVICDVGEYLGDDFRLETVDNKTDEYYIFYANKDFRIYKEDGRWILISSIYACKDLLD